MAEIYAANLTQRESYSLLTGAVVPRPIAWVSTLSPEGVRNLAPHSYFSIVSSEPPMVQFTSAGEKDTLRNVRATGEFVINVVSRNLLDQMNATAINAPPDVDEFQWADLVAVDSETVGPPRVALARIALECTLTTILTLGNGNVIVGSVNLFQIADELLIDGKINSESLDPVGRLAGPSYMTLEAVRSITRPTWESRKGVASAMVRDPSDR